MRSVVWFILLLAAGPAMADEPTADANVPADITATETEAAETTEAVEDVAETVEADGDQPPTTQPAEAEATGGESNGGITSQQADRVMSNRVGELVPTPADRERELAEQMTVLVQRPEPQASDEEVYRQLSSLNSNAIELYNTARPGPLQLQALSVQMQADYANIVDAPSDADISGYLTNLRTNARWAKTLEVDEARSTGDFWLMTAELVEINRSPLPLEARQRQAAEQMDEYLDRHPDAPPAKSVRQALTSLNTARGIKSETDAPATQPATTQPTTQPTEAEVEVDVESDAGVLKETSDTVTDAAETTAEAAEEVIAPLEQGAENILDSLRGD